MHEVRQESLPNSYELFELGESFLQKLNSVIKHAQFYPEGHPILNESINNFQLFLKTIFVNYARMNINFFERDVFVFNRFVPRLGDSFEKLISFLEEREILEITILPGVTNREIYDFAKAISDKVENIRSADGVQAILANLDIVNIIVTNAKPKQEEKREDDFDADFNGVSEETYHQAVSVIKEIARNVLEGTPINLNKARKLVDSLVEKVLENPDALIRLSILKNYDEDTYYHSVNVMLLSIALGAALGFDKVTLSALGLASLLHDVGKVKIPPEILKKPDHLTADEWRIMQMHTVWGAQSLLTSKNISKVASITALEHHLGVDGSGYPELRLIRKPHIFSRIVSVVDVYDALTTLRAYRKPTLPDNALRVIHIQSGKKLDPLISKTFIKMMGLYPVGSVVKLVTGEYGVVVKPGKQDITRPKVIVLLDKDLNAYSEPLKIDLLEEARRGGPRHTILEAVEPASVGIDPRNYVVPQE